MPRITLSVGSFAVLPAWIALIVAVGCSKPDTSAPAEQPAGNDTAAGQAAAPLAKSEVLVDLPQDTCNTPDGMCLLPDGNVILSMPNFNDLTQQSALWKITPNNKAERFLELPNHPETGKPVGSLGVCVAPSGDLYLADFQMEGKRQSRVLRIVIKDGKPADVVTVASGFAVSNAVIVRNGHLYVTDTQIDTTVTPAISGVFRFKLGEEDVELKTPPTDDPHLIATIECHDEELPLGADGLAFDKQGNLYVSNFADGTVHKLTLDEQGNVATNEIFAKAEFMKCADGLFFDPVKELIYVADSRANAVHAVALDGSVRTLAQNGDTDGADGGMDQPCEVLLRGRELIVSNMDWPVPGCVNQQYDKPCVITAIRLDQP